MKMGAGIFWGIVLIIIGISFLLRIFFDISIIRIIIAVLFILIGIKILADRPNIHSEGSENHVIFSERMHKPTYLETSEYNTIFGKTVYDFREADSVPGQRIKLTFNTVFGGTTILLPKSIPVTVKADAVFSSVILPNGNSIAFGSTNYKSGNAEGNIPHLAIDAHVVFGSIEIKQ